MNNELIAFNKEHTKTFSDYRREAERKENKDILKKELYLAIAIIGVVLLDKAISLFF